MQASFTNIRLSKQQSDRSNEFVTDQYPISGPMVSTFDEKLIKVRDLVIKDGFGVRISGQCFVFAPSVGQWVSLYSRIASRMICDITGMTNVSSGFLSAAAPYLAVIDRVTTIAYNLPSSFCVSTYRMTLEVKDNMTAVCKPITLGSTSSSRYKVLRIGGICTNPLECMTVPTKVDMSAVSSVDRFLLNNLDTRELNLVKWFVGNGLLDPVRSSKVLVLYGLRGGEGKSIVCNTLMSVLRGCMKPMDRDYMGTTCTPSQESLSDMLSYRFLYWGDSKIQKGYVNDVNWKVLTGGDMISVGGGVVKFQASVLLATNNLWRSSYDIRKNWFTRRTLCIPMHRRYTGDSVVQEAFEEREMVRFALSCLYMRITSPSPPTTPEVIVATIFGSRSSVASRAIELKDTEYDEFGNQLVEDLIDNVAGTMSLSLAGQIEYDMLIQLATDISPHSVVSRRSIKAIRGIRTQG